jgi:hypothetical protein
MRGKGVKYLSQKNLLVLPLVTKPSRLQAHLVDGGGILQCESVGGSAFLLLMQGSEDAWTLSSCKL